MALPARMKLGDVVGRAARHVHADLQRSIDALARQTEDRRTLSLRDLVQRSRVILLQLLVLCRWIGSPETAELTARIEAVKARVGAGETALNGDVDRLFYLHAGLYPMRTRRFDVATAVHLINYGTYAHLPTSLLLSDHLSTEQSDVDKPAMLAHLDTYIQAKLCLHDTVPSSIDELTVADGCLHLQKHSWFELRLTLSDLSDQAGWVIVDFAFAITHHASHGFDFNGVNVHLDTAKTSVMQTLAKVTESGHNSLENLCLVCR